MTAEDKAKNLESWARYFKKNPDVAAHYARLAEEMRGDVLTDTRPKCCAWMGFGTCGQPVQGDGLCAAHFADGVL